MSTSVAFKAASSSGNFSNSGQNQYRPMRRRRGGSESNILEFGYLARADRRMVFDRGQDPTFLAFEHIDNLPLHKVITEMTKETIQDFKKIDLKTSFESLMKRR